MQKWYQMPTFKKWRKKRFFIPALFGFLIKKPLLKIFYWRNGIKYFYFASFVMGLFFLKMICEIQQMNTDIYDINVNYYTCELNELTHKLDNNGRDYMCEGWIEGSDIVYPEPNLSALLDYYKCVENEKIDCYKKLTYSNNQTLGWVEYENEEFLDKYSFDGTDYKFFRKMYENN